MLYNLVSLTIRSCAKMDKATIKIFVGPHGAGKTEVAKRIAANLNIQCVVMDMTYRSGLDYKGIGVPEINPFFSDRAVAVLEDFDGASENAKKELLSYTGLINSDAKFHHTSTF